MGGVGSRSARVPHGRVTKYVSKGAAKLVLRNPIRANGVRENNGGGGEEEGSGGDGEVADVGGAGGDPDQEVWVDEEPEFIIH